MITESKRNVASRHDPYAEQACLNRDTGSESRRAEPSSLQFTILAECNDVQHYSGVFKLGSCILTNYDRYPIVISVDQTYIVKSLRFSQSSLATYTVKQTQSITEQRKNLPVTLISVSHCPFIANQTQMRVICVCIQSLDRALQTTEWCPMILLSCGVQYPPFGFKRILRL